MSAWKLIDECTELGIVLRTRQGRLCAMPTQGKPPEGFKNRLKDHKEEILHCLGQLTDFADLGELPPLTTAIINPIDEIQAWKAKHGKTDSK